MFSSKPNSCVDNTCPPQEFSPEVEQLKWKQICGEGLCGLPTLT